MQPKFWKPAPGEPVTVRFLPPAEQHYAPTGSSKAVFVCKGSSCPACVAGAQVQRKVNVPVQSTSGPGHMSLSAKAARAWGKQLHFGAAYGRVGDELRNRLGAGRWGLGRHRKAPLRKRKKRIAKKIEQRVGWMTCGMARECKGLVISATPYYIADRAEAARAAQLTFGTRPDVVEMRERMLAEGVPRAERQKAYRALRRLTVRDPGDAFS